MLQYHGGSSLDCSCSCFSNLLRFRSNRSFRCFFVVSVRSDSLRRIVSNKRSKSVKTVEVGCEGGASAVTKSSRAQARKCLNNRIITNHYRKSSTITTTTGSDSCTSDGNDTRTFCCTQSRINTARGWQLPN